MIFSVMYSIMAQRELFTKTNTECCFINTCLSQPADVSKHKSGCSVCNFFMAQFSCSTYKY